MKILLHRSHFVLLLVILAIGLVACNEKPGVLALHYTPEVESIHEWTIEELADLPEALSERGMGMYILLPESGFESINDIRDYLLQFYTPNWIDAELSHDFSILYDSWHRGYEYAYPFQAIYRFILKAPCI